MTPLKWGWVHSIRLDPERTSDLLDSGRLSCQKQSHCPGRPEGLLNLRRLFRDARGCLSLNAFVYLFAMNGDVWRRGEAEAHLAAFHTEHSDGHFIANLDRLSETSAQNEHGASPLI